MGDMGDSFKAWADFRQAKRKANRESSAQLLADAGVAFTSHNEGAHLKLEGGWDLYPGTGLYTHESLPVRGRGVRNLLRELGR